MARAAEKERKKREMNASIRDVREAGNDLNCSIGKIGSAVSHDSDDTSDDARAMKNIILELPPTPKRRMGRRSTVTKNSHDAWEGIIPLLIDEVCMTI